MSAIAGIYHRDGSPADAGLLAEISRRLASLGPDGEQFAARGPVAMAYRPFETYRRSRRSDAPAVGSDGALIAFDGRLDNASEVERAIASPRPAASDEQLLLAVYRQRGLQGLAICVGDFALALWDPAARTLVLCCDGLGRRPLYYRVTRDTVLWSSSARALVEGAGLAMKIDEEYVADYLSNLPSVRSPFAGVSRLTGGHALVVEPDREEIVRYWSFDPNRTVRYRDDRDYEQHFSELFQTAVACRLAADGPVFSELSGGLDSGTVTCVANHLIDRGAVPCRTLRTVSYVYDRSETADERPFMQPVETFLGRSGLHVLESDHPFITPMAASFRPEHPTNVIWAVDQSDRVTSEMRRAGSRVILSGLGGDQVFWSQPNVALLLADFVADRQFGAMLREASRWSRLLRRPAMQLLFEASRIAHRKQYVGKSRIAPWLDRGFVARTDLRARMRRLAPQAAAFRLPTMALQCQAILSAMRPHALEPCSTRGYVDRRYPFLDRRLAEFALAIPVDQKVRLGESRSIVRRGLKGLVPDLILQRRTKAGPDEAFTRALIRQRQWMTALFREPLVSAYGLMDRTLLQAAVIRSTLGDASQQLFVMRSLSLELWLRTLEERYSTSEATAPPGWREPQQQPQEHTQGEHHEQRQEHARTARFVRSA
jgi:asparagine synthase (glutamine-hydrolysing)